MKTPLSLNLIIFSVIGLILVQVIGKIKYDIIVTQDSLEKEIDRLETEVAGMTCTDNGGHFKEPYLHTKIVHLRALEVLTKAECRKDGVTYERDGLDWKTTESKLLK